MPAISFVREVAACRLEFPGGSTGITIVAGRRTGSFVYYTHSFHAPVVTETAAASEYGLRFAGAVERGNIFGVQFHPEKSGDVGLSILKNFCEV